MALLKDASGNTFELDVSKPNVNGYGIKVNGSYNGAGKELYISNGQAITVNAQNNKYKYTGGGWSYVGPATGQAVQETSVQTGAGAGAPAKQAGFNITAEAGNTKPNYLWVIGGFLLAGIITTIVVFSGKKKRRR